MGSSVILPPQGQPKKGPDPSFKSATIPNLVSFGLDRISPPSSLYLQRDDQLFLSMESQRGAGDTVSFVWRILQAAPDVAGQPDAPAAAALGQAGGQITQTVKTQAHQLTGALRTNVQAVLPMAEGYLLSMSVTATNASGRGQTFAQAGIMRKGPLGTMIFLPLFSDYVTTLIVPGWPGGRAISPVEGPGQIASVQQANPGAGADWTFTVPNFARMRFQSFNAVLTASAAVANRQVNIIVDDGANIVWQHDVGTNITAGQTASISGTGTNATVGLTTTELFVVLPPGLVLTQAMRIRSATTGIQAGDQWSAIFFLVEEWLEL